MVKYLKIFRNKYVISSLLMIIYILLLHDTDIVSLNKRKEKVAQLEKEINHKKHQIIELKSALNELEDVKSLETFAREKYFFKKSSEDIFVLSDE